MWARGLICVLCGVSLSQRLSLVVDSRLSRPVSLARCLSPGASRPVSLSPGASRPVAGETRASCAPCASCSSGLFTAFLMPPAGRRGALSSAHTSHSLSTLCRGAEPVFYGQIQAKCMTQHRPARISHKGFVKPYTAPGRRAGRPLPRSARADHQAVLVVDAGQCVA